MERLKNDGKDEDKLLLHFRGDDPKPLICNRTNFDSISDLYGDDTDAWPGRAIELYVDPRVRFGTRVVPGIRVRAPRRPSRPVATTPPRIRPRTIQRNHLAIRDRNRRRSTPSRTKSPSTELEGRKSGREEFLAPLLRNKTNRKPAPQ
jgi:hypothetical protein